MKKICSLFLAMLMCVYGPISGNAWDISLNDAYAQDVHNGVAAITPKSQAENYMDRVNLD